MQTRNAAGAIALCLLSAGLVWAVPVAPEVVTNPTPALSATMTLAGVSGDCFTWNVQGKVKAAYRGFGARVQLLCMPYSSLQQGGCAGAQVFPVCEGACPQNVDACGNFAFDATTCGTGPQLDNTNFCTFVVHVDGSSSPQSCGNNTNNSGPVQDPNGTAPCSGGLCPNSP
jgi:hypothetical protein